MGYRYHNYTDTAELEDIGMTLANFLRYAMMAFRPAETLLICTVLTLLVAIPCVLILINSESSSTRYAIAMAIVTGVIASGLVSLTLEMCNNYRHNRKRFVVLNYYLHIVSSYEEYINCSSHGKYEKYNKDACYYLSFQKTGEISNRLHAVAELVLIVAPPVDEALEKGSEYLAVKEMQYATRVKDAAEDILEIAKNQIFEHMKNHNYSFFDCLEEKYRDKLVAYTLETVYKIEDVLHIHGGVSSVSDIDPIMGHCNYQDIEEHRRLAGEADEVLNEGEASIHRAIANYLRSIYKDTNSIISLSESFWEKLSDIDAVVVVGWAAGKADWPYLRKIQKSIKDDTKWHVYYYDNKALAALSKAMQEEGIEGKYEVTYMQTREFWD